MGVLNTGTEACFVGYDGGMRIIAHLDIDAFFAAVEERDEPRFRGLPVVVGANPLGGGGRGVVSTANYKAREYGIRSAMPISRAWRLSENARMAGKPGVVFLGVNSEKYAEVSWRIRGIILEHLSYIEQASVDEFYLDYEVFLQKYENGRKYEKAEETCKKIKREILKREGLTCSVGIGPNKLVAKIASDFRKPDGLTLVLPEEVESFLNPLSVRAIPGVGPKTEAVLQEKGVKIVSDLKKFSLEELGNTFGKWGVDLYYKARGVDESVVCEDREVKSVGEQETFLEDTSDVNYILERFRVLSELVLARLKREGFKNFRTIVIIVRFFDFQTVSRTRTLPRATSSTKEMYFEAMKMVLPFLDGRENPQKKLIRLIGIRVEKLQS